MSWRGEPICEWSELPKDECAHCTGAIKRFEQSLKPEADVDDPEMWEDDDEGD